MIAVQLTATYTTLTTVNVVCSGRTGDYDSHIVIQVSIEHVHSISHVTVSDVLTFNLKTFSTS